MKRLSILESINVSDFSILNHIAEWLGLVARKLSGQQVRRVGSILTSGATSSMPVSHQETNDGLARLPVRAFRNLDAKQRIS